METINKSEALLSALTQGNVKMSQKDSGDTSAEGSDQFTIPQSLEVIDDTDGKVDENNVYYFESDHLALKGNQEYQNLLRTIALLESQRTKAIKDLDTLIECRDHALTDPIQFVQKLQNGVDIGIPEPQKIATIPTIHWEKYTSGLGPITFNKHKHMTRNKKQESEADSEATVKDFGPLTPQASDLIPNDPDTTFDSTASQLNNAAVVRGRLKDTSKSATFNQLWTTEEQKRLEELLIIHPPEEVEARRWQKIAKSLGNRTLQQVASRVQKYFIKLAKSGLPVPGRMPNVQSYNRRGNHRHQRHNRLLYSSSTFLQSYEPRVYMSDDDDSYSYGDSSTDFDIATAMSQDLDVSDDDTIPPELQDTDEYQELLDLKRLKKHMLREEACGPAQHIGYKCDQCECDPIVGVRWHCSDCPADNAVDLCDECVDSFFETTLHNSSHRLEPLQQAVNSSHVDGDYTKFVPGDYNYLDPNYMPAT